MFVSKKKYQELQGQLEILEIDLQDEKDCNEILRSEIDGLQKAYIEKAELKAILEKLTKDSHREHRFGFGGNIGVRDEVAVYVDDLFNKDKKVIRQEANTAILISVNGDVVEGYTREKNDKGYNYALIRDDGNTNCKDE